MITLDDIRSVVIGSSCAQSSPCQHRSTVTLKDGRVASDLTSYQICAIISALSNEKINPEGKEHWKGDQVKQHFKDYSESRNGWKAEAADTVLTKIFFLSIFPQEPALNLIISEAKQFAREDTPLLDFILKMIHDEEFKKDPRAYLDAWRKRIGPPKEYKKTEEIACFFFFDHIRYL